MGTTRLAASRPIQAPRYAAPLGLVLLGVTVTAGLWLRGLRHRQLESLPPPPAAAAALEVTASPALPALRDRGLLLPVDGVRRQDLRDTFAEGRRGHTHEAIDILAPRNTPVRAVEAGTVVKLFHSVPGGITVYQFDDQGEYCYYYAHLERYAEGLTDGQRVQRGQVLGYVGTSGNAPESTPHLHFAIFRLHADKRWWEGDAIDPYPILHGD